MRVFRATNAGVMQYIEPHLVLDSSTDKATFCLQLTDALINAPQSVFVIVAFENEKLLGFLVAIAHAGVSYTYVAQLWTETGVARRFELLVLSRLKAWTESLGRDSIRMETQRDPASFSRRWKFKEISTIMELKIENPNEIFNDEEVDSGSTEISQHTELGPEADRQVAEGNHPEAAERSSECVSGADRFAAGSSVSISETGDQSDRV